MNILIDGELSNLSESQQNRLFFWIRDNNEQTYNDVFGIYINNDTNPVHCVASKHYFCNGEMHLVNQFVID